MEFVKISSKAFTALVANKIELQYLPSLSINYVAIGKDLKKLPPQVCWIKMKTCYDQGCNEIGVVIATKLRHYARHGTLDPRHLDQKSHCYASYLNVCYQMYVFRLLVLIY